VILVSTFVGLGLGLLALMFLPPLVALLRGQFLISFIVFTFVIMSILALIPPVVVIAIWLAALCVSPARDRGRLSLSSGDNN
jgi:hypothetical protein